jgi:hypothetical protein
MEPIQRKVFGNAHFKLITMPVDEDTPADEEPTERFVPDADTAAWREELVRIPEDSPAEQGFKVDRDYARRLLEHLQKYKRR